MTSLYSQDLNPWRGERINGVLYPSNIAWLWPEVDLADIGLYRAQIPEVIPEGKQPSAEVEWDGDCVRYVLEDIPPPERRRVEKYLIIERLAAAGKGPAAKALLDAPGNEVAYFKWNAPVPSVYFDDADTMAMIAYLGEDPAEIMAP